MTTRRLFYFGLGMDEFEILLQEPSIDLVAVGRLPGPATERAWYRNPAQFLFHQGYRIAASILSASQKRALARPICSVLSSAPSAGARQKGRYLKAIIERNIEIIDTSSSDAVREASRRHAVDLTVVIGWGLLRPEIIQAPKFGTLNVHPSRLPRHRGSMPLLWALKCNDPSTAVTYHLLDAGMDTGDIVAQFGFEISPNDDVLSLEGRFRSEVRRTLIPTIDRYLRGLIKPKAQERAGATKTGRLQHYRQIHWETESAREIANKTAFYAQVVPVPGQFAYTFLAKRWTPVRKVRIVDSAPSTLSLNPGSFVVRGRELFMRTIDGVLGVTGFEGLRFQDWLRVVAKRSGQFSSQTSPTSAYGQQLSPSPDSGILELFHQVSRSFPDVNARLKPTAGLDYLAWSDPMSGEILYDPQKLVALDYSPEALCGLFAHELAHQVDYLRMNVLLRLCFTRRYRSKREFRVQCERRVDGIAVERGFAYQLRQLFAESKIRLDQREYRSLVEELHLSITEIDQLEARSLQGRGLSSPSSFDKT